MSIGDIKISQSPRGGKITISRTIYHPVYGKATLTRDIPKQGGLLTAYETACYLDVSPRWVREMVKSGKLKPRKRKGHNLFQLRDLRSYKESKELKESQENGLSNTGTAT